MSLEKLAMRRKLFERKTREEAAVVCSSKHDNNTQDDLALNLTSFDTLVPVKRRNRLPGAAADAATNETRITMQKGELVCVPGEAAKALEKYRVVAASAVIATGALYVLLGLCCCRRYRRRLAHAELQRAYLAERAHRTGTPVAEA